MHTASLLLNHDADAPLLVILRPLDEDEEEEEEEEEDEEFQEFQVESSRSGASETRPPPLSPHELH